jgi:hypothetical protein
MRGSGTWTDAERPQNYRETILYLYPNGDAPLTAIMSKLGSEATNDPHFHWFTQAYRNKGFALTGSGVYTDEGLGTAYSSNTATSGTILTAKVTLDTAKRIREGHEVLLRTSDDHSNDVVGVVTRVKRTDDSTSSVSFMLKQADGSGNTGLADADRLLIVGNMNAEGGVRPEAISYNTSEWYNYCQIFRNPLKISRTAMKTRLRTGDQYKKLKKEALEDHSVEMEDAFIWGIPTLDYDAEGQPIRTTGGIVHMLRTGAPENVIDASRVSAYAGDTFANFGKSLLDNLMEQSFRNGKATEKFVLCGNGFMLGVQQIVEANSMYRIEAAEMKYGIKVNRLISPFGEWYIKRAPRFTQEASSTQSALVLEPEHLKYRYIDDTFFTADEQFKKGGGDGTDGKIEEYITECGLELHHPQLHMYISMFGSDNVLTP